MDKKLDPKPMSSYKSPGWSYLARDILKEASIQVIEVISNSELNCDLTSWKRAFFAPVPNNKELQVNLN